MTRTDIFLQEAIAEAKTGLQEGGIPIGSVIVHNDKIIGRGHNKRIQKGSVVLHAEMDALENAGRQRSSIYKNCTLYTTLSPCPMCTGAILLYGIPKVIIGENRTYMGAEALLKQNGVEVIVVNNHECIEMMENFIKTNPHLWNEDIGV
jgi:creatinine deaminase